MIGINLSEEPRAIREAKEEGREEGREEQTISLISRQLMRRFQQGLPEEIRSRLVALPLSILEELSEDLLDFNSLNDLERWISQHSASAE